MANPTDNSAAAKVAIVTGANRGLGLTTCLSLSRHGFHIVAVCRDEEKAKLAAGRVVADGGDADFFVADVAAPSAGRELAEFIERRLGRADALVNNAGVIAEGGVADMRGIAESEPDKVAETINVNALGAYRITAALLPLLKKAPAGRIVNVSSELGRLDGMGAGLPGYRMSKAAMNAMTATLSAELGAESPLKVNSVSPGWVRTDMGGDHADRDIREGVAGIIWAALLPADGPTGGFFRDGKPLPW